MIITLTGASGAGKTSIAKKLLEDRLDLKMVISFTTRAERPSDLPGEYLCRMPPETFNETERFLWVVQAHGDHYGTLRESVDSALRKPAPSLMTLVPEAVAKLRDYALGMGVIVSFYVLSPNESELRRRLVLRGDTHEAVERRIADCATMDATATISEIPYRFIENTEPEEGIERAARAIAAEIEKLQKSLKTILGEKIVF